MGEFIQGVVLSDFMIFAVMFFAGLFITGWAITQREYAGYALGWLVGIFLIMLLSTLIPNTDSTVVEEGVETASSNSVNFFAALIPSIIGFGIGFGIPTTAQMMQTGTQRRSRALTVASLLALTISSGYLMMIVPFSTRIIVSVFDIAIWIGILLFMILVRQKDREVIRAEAQEVRDINDEPIMVEGEIRNSPINRFRRNRVQAYRNE